MSDDAPPKSAFELAMERLREQDRAAGRAAPRELSAAQKRRIAEARAEGKARLAQAEILHRERREKATTREELTELDEHYEIDRRRIESDVEEKVRAIKDGAS